MGHRGSFGDLSARSPEGGATEPALLRRFSAGRDQSAFIVLVNRHGAIFTNVLLAEEIDRTTPRTQSALPKAMNESPVSVDGQTYRLDPPLFVLATQNPFEYEGT